MFPVKTAQVQWATLGQICALTGLAPEQLTHADIDGTRDELLAAADRYGHDSHRAFSTAIFGLEARCREVAGQRSCRPLAGAAPMAVFTAAEADELGALPAKPFVLATWSRGTVGPDIHVKAGHTLYSVPWRHIGRRVDIRATAAMVQIFDDGQLIATHPYQASGKRTDIAHYPPERIAFTCARRPGADSGPPRSGRRVSR